MPLIPENFKPVVTTSLNIIDVIKSVCKEYLTAEVDVLSERQEFTKFIFNLRNNPIKTLKPYSLDALRTYSAPLPIRPQCAALYHAMTLYTLSLKKGGFIDNDSLVASANTIFFETIVDVFGNYLINFDKLCIERLDDFFVELKSAFTNALIVRLSKIAKSKANVEDCTTANPSPVRFSPFLRDYTPNLLERRDTFDSTLGEYVEDLGFIPDGRETVMPEFDNQTDDMFVHLHTEDSSETPSFVRSICSEESDDSNESSCVGVWRFVCSGTL